MNIHVLVFRKVDKRGFGAVKDGLKKIETRAATPRYQKIKAGDSIKFVCGKSKFIKKVKRVELFKSISEMLKKYKVREINPFIKSEKELRNMYKSYPKYTEKLRKFGLIAIEFK